MQQDKDSNKDKKETKVGGFDLANLFNNAPFISSSNKVISLSFELNDIIDINNNELMKILFNNGLTVRLMKFKNENNAPCVTFDIVNDSTKEILIKTKKQFVGGLGLAAIFYEMNYITQWEIPILEKLSRSFVLGDVETIKDLISTYNLRISRDSEWYIKNRIGLK